MDEALTLAAHPSHPAGTAAADATPYPEHASIG